MLYSLLDSPRGNSATVYILAAIIAHSRGLFTCGLLCQVTGGRQSMMLAAWALLSRHCPLFSSPTYGMGGGLSADTLAAARGGMGIFFRAFTPERGIKSVADVPVYSNC